MDINKKIGLQIKLARIQAGLTQMQLGKKLKRTGAAIAYLEQGKRRVGIDLLSKIAEITGNNLSFFLQEEIQDRSKQLSSLNQQIEEIKELLTKREEELNKSDHRYKSLLENSPDCVFVSRINNYQFTEVNDRACKNYGYNQEEFLKMKIFDIEVDPPVEKQVRKLYDSTPIGQVVEIYGTNKRKDGSTFPVHVRFTKLDDEFALANVRDITDQKKIKDH